MPRAKNSTSATRSVASSQAKANDNISYLWWLLGGIVCIFAVCAVLLRNAGGSADDADVAPVVVAGADAPADEDWLELVTWMRKNGGSVHHSVRTGLVSIAGFQVRGVVADSQLESGTVLFQLPQKLVLKPDSKKGVRLGLEQLEECRMSESSLNALKMQMKLAIEIRKGATSFFAPYLKMLPTLSDFRTFHPFLANASVVSDFGELPILRILSDNFWTVEDQKTRCIEAWNRTSKGASFSLHMEDIWHTQFLKYTRHINENMVPFFDLLNTGLQSQVNAKVKVEDKYVSMVTLKTVLAGAELVNSYCEDCDNEAMLAIHGVYLEDSSRGLNDFASTNCSALFRRETGPELASSLKETSLAELDLESKHVPSPRCRQNAQPMRCMLARLAWETCAKEWGFPGAARTVQRRPSEKSKLQHLQAQYNTGMVLRQQGDLRGALKSFQAALRINPALENLQQGITDLKHQIKHR